MDINTLPNEMLVSILKYSNPSCLVQLRKLNCGIDNTAKRSGLCKLLPVEMCRITFGNYKTPIWIKICMDETLATSYRLPKYIFEFNDSLAMNHNRTEQVISRFKANTCVINGFAYDDHLAFMKRHENTLSKTKELHLESSSFDENIEKQKQFLDLFTKCKKLRLHKGVDTSMLSVEVLGRKRLQSLEVIHKYSEPNTFGYPGIDDRFLLTIIFGCKQVLIPLHEGTNITMNGLHEVLLMISSSPDFEGNWILGTIIAEKTKILEVLNTIAEMNSLRGVDQNTISRSLLGSGTVFDIRINYISRIHVVISPNNPDEPL